MISPQDLKYFQELARSLNVTRASERLGVTQPALTQTLKRLENAGGAALFLRSKKGLQLTRAGERLLRSSQELLEAWDRVTHSIKESEGEIAGTFKLGCHTAVAKYTLPVFLKGLLDAHPRLEFQFRHDLSRHIADEVIQWKLDFGIVVNPPAHPDLVIRTLCEDEVTLWQVPGSARDVLIFDPDLLQSREILEKLKKTGPKFPRSLTSSSLETIAALVKSGVGVGILPRRVLKSEGEGPVRKVCSTAPVVRDRICLVYRAGTQNNRAARAVIDAILAGKY